MRIGTRGIALHCRNCCIMTVTTYALQRQYECERTPRRSDGSKETERTSARHSPEMTSTLSVARASVTDLHTLSQKPQPANIHCHITQWSDIHTVIQAVTCQHTLSHNSTVWYTHCHTGHVTCQHTLSHNSMVWYTHCHTGCDLTTYTVT